MTNDYYEWIGLIYKACVHKEKTKTNTCYSYRWIYAEKWYALESRCHKSTSKKQEQQTHSHKSLAPFIVVPIQSGRHLVLFNFSGWIGRRSRSQACAVYVLTAMLRSQLFRMNIWMEFVRGNRAALTYEVAYRAESWKRACALFKAIVIFGCMQHDNDILANRVTMITDR